MRLQTATSQMKAPRSQLVQNYGTPGHTGSKGHSVLGSYTNSIPRVVAHKLKPPASTEDCWDFQAARGLQRAHDTQILHCSRNQVPKTMRVKVFIFVAMGQSIFLSIYLYTGTLSVALQIAQRAQSRCYSYTRSHTLMLQVSKYKVSTQTTIAVHNS